MPCGLVDWSGDWATHWTPPGSSALCESKAAATIVLSVRKRSDSNNKCFICAKAKRQRQSAQSERKSTTRFDWPLIL